MNQPTEFQQLFARVEPEVIQAAVAPFRSDPRLQDVWVFVLMQDKVSSHAEVYRYDGEVVTLENLDRRLPHLGLLDEVPLDVSQSLLPLFFELEDQSQLPNRALVHHDVTTQKTSADFSYDRVEKRPGEISGDVVQRWADAFRG